MLSPALSSFFSSNAAPPSLSSSRLALDTFLSAALTRGARVALVTSGGTAVPLERRCVRFIDNFSTGARGACLAERLVAGAGGREYAVVYLHRVGARRPFLHEALAAVGAQAALGADPAALAAADAAALGDLSVALAAHRRAISAGALLELPFVTLSDYLHMLREAACALAPAGGAALVLLAAAVSDWHLAELAEHKMQSGGGGGGGGGEGGAALSLDLTPVPKALRALTSLWCPRALVVSFKLETDTALLLPKAAAALHSAGVTAVVANLLHRRYEEVLLVRAAEGTARVSVADSTCADETGGSARADEAGGSARAMAGGSARAMAGVVPDAEQASGSERDSAAEQASGSEQAAASAGRGAPAARTAAPPLFYDGGGLWTARPPAQRAEQGQPPPDSASVTEWRWELAGGEVQAELAITAICLPGGGAGGAVPRPELEDRLARALAALHEAQERRGAEGAAVGLP